jgi:hypothetical protein
MIFVYLLLSRMLDNLCCDHIAESRLLRTINKMINQRLVSVSPIVICSRDVLTLFWAFLTPRHSVYCGVSLCKISSKYQRQGFVVRYGGIRVGHRCRPLFIFITSHSQHTLECIRESL